MSLWTENDFSMRDSQHNRGIQSRRLGCDSVAGCQKRTPSEALRRMIYDSKIRISMTARVFECTFAKLVEIFK
jgi:hypothetical protein